MKKITLLLFLLITSTTIYSQELKPLKIFHSIDEMTKEERYYPSRRLVYADTITKSGELKVESFGISLTLDKKKGVKHIAPLEALRENKTLKMVGQEEQFYFPISLFVEENI